MRYPCNEDLMIPQIGSFNTLNDSQLSYGKCTSHFNNTLRFKYLLVLYFW